MAGSHTVGEAFAILRHRPDLRQVDDSAWYINAANEAFALMWNSFNWDDSIKIFPPFHLIPNQAYHDAPYIEIPSDFGQLHQAEIHQLYSGDAIELTIRKRKTPSLFRATPDQISWLPERPGFILYPTPSEAWASPESHVTGLYKSLPPAVTTDNFDSGLLPFADKHFPAFRAACLWAYMSYMGHPGVGNTTWQDGRVVRTGALAAFYDTLGETVFYEDQGRGFGEIAPSDGLMEGNYY